MKIRLGYVSPPVTIPKLKFSNITYTSFKKDDIIKKYEKHEKVIQENLKILKQILIYNGKNKIHFYRMTSHLFPFLGFDKVLFDYINPYIKQYQEIGTLLKKYDIRMDIHPDQFVVLNSIDSNIANSSIQLLKIQAEILQAIQIENPIIILHVGSSKPDKETAIKRFIQNFNKLPLNVQKMIAIENDDKVFTALDVLSLCKYLNIPMVLDYHHFLCNNKEEKLDSILNDIFITWEKTKLNPKIHFSSPKSKIKKEIRHHHDYIDYLEFKKFLKILKTTNKDVDIMIEAKKKDEALFRLVRNIKYDMDLTFLDNTTFKL